MIVLVRLNLWLERLELGVSRPSAFVLEGVNAKVDPLPVRLALRVLLPHCPESWPLVNLWDSAGQDNDIGRAQGVNAAFNGVVLQAKSGGLAGAQGSLTENTLFPSR